MYHNNNIQYICCVLMRDPEDIVCLKFYDNTCSLLHIIIHSFSSNIELQKSGLSAFIGEQLEVLGSMPPWAMNIVLTLIIAMLTEVTSNSATTTLILPILANLVCLTVLILYCVV